jgi:prepilin-type processing-associated H-X9-DG protein
VANLWGYGFNQGASWNDGNGLVEVGPKYAFQPTNSGATVPVSVNGTIVNATIRGTIRPGRTLSQVASPSVCFMMSDTNDIPYDSMELAALRPVESGDGNCEQLTHAHAPRHSGGYNYAFVDGHVKWIKYTGGPMISTAESGSQPLATPAADFCFYYSKYDGGNDPGGCKELQNTEDDTQ